MDTLTTYLQQAEQSARYLVQTVPKDIGTCESCGKYAITTYNLGSGYECGNCFYDSVTYWERREGTTTEAIFDGDPFPEGWKYGGKEHRTVVARHHTVLAVVLNEGSK